MNAQDHVDSSAPKDKVPGAKPRRRAPAKPPMDTGKRSLNLRIDQESYRRLNVHALMTDRTVSDLVMEFAKSLKDFSMPHRLNGSATDQGGADGR